MADNEREPQLDGHCCEEDCPACSDELCMTHDGPCACDTVARHLDPSGRHWVGVAQGIFTVMELDVEVPDETR
jgi:hypothetical protein